MWPDWLPVYAESGIWQRGGRYCGKGSGGDPERNFRSVSLCASLGNEKAAENSGFFIIGAQDETRTHTP